MKHFPLLFYDILLKIQKYRFGLQKGVKNSIRQDFLIRDPHIVGSFICYFCLKMTGTPQTYGGGVFRRKTPPPCGLKSVTFKLNRLVRKMTQKQDLMPF